MVDNRQSMNCGSDSEGEIRAQESVLKISHINEVFGVTVGSISA